MAMTEPWPTVPFSELYAEDSRNGLMRPKRVRGAGYKMINMGELFAYDRISDPPMELVPMNEAEKVKYSLRPGDLLFARQSLIASGAGKCSIVLDTPEVTTYESHLIRVRLNSERTDPLFYYYYFSSPAGKGNVQSLVMQVAAAGIRASELAQLPMPFPPLPTQRKIAAILSAYDDLIENNTRRIALLEEMARRLYHEWFVRFRFPGHESARLVDSPLGKIPEGWKVVKVETIIKRLKAGTVYTQADVARSGRVPVVDQSRDSILGFHDNEPDHWATPESPFIIFGDHTCKMQLMIEPFSIGPNVVPFVSNGGIPISYLYHLVNSLVETREYKRHWTELVSKLIILAPNEYAEHFASFAKPIFVQIDILMRRDLVLRRTRDLLLPRLVSGAVDVEGMSVSPCDDAVPISNERATDHA
jgi:type I restriction enzyme S subunit